jgi:hypothetical protein
MHDYTRDPASPPLPAVGVYVRGEGCGVVLCGAGDCLREHVATWGLSDEHRASWERLARRARRHKARWHGGARGSAKEEGA